MGRVMNVQRFCTEDGPGIRATLFLKGCPLNCVWCHNPEGKRPGADIAYDARRCLGCGRCVAACPKGCHALINARHSFERSHCESCGACAEVCPGALEIAGAEMSASEASEALAADADFYQASGGGITLSGGEPLMQADFAREILMLCRAKGLKTCIETSCFAPWESFEAVLTYTDLFLCDWKLTDDARHLRYVGQSNALIRENILKLDAAGAKLRLRCPIIPGVNATPEHFRGIAELAGSLRRLERVEIMPYHNAWTAKCDTYGFETPPAFRVPAAREIEAWIAEIKRYTNVEVRKG